MLKTFHLTFSTSCLEGIVFILCFALIFQSHYRQCSEVYIDEKVYLLSVKLHYVRV